MIRPTTMLCMIAAFGSGLYLYSEKHRTEMLDRKIASVFKATQAAHERTGLLRAEWAGLNDPERLQDLAGKYLALQPMAPAQLVPLSELAKRLPAPSAVAPEGSTDDDVADADAPSDMNKAGTDKPDAAPPAASPAEDAPKPDVPKIIAHADIKPRPPHHVTLARTEPPHDQVRPIGAPLPLAAPQPVGAAYMSALARPLPARRQPSVVAAVPSYPTASPYVGSALGGRGSLPPPVPYTGAQ
jgi:hypothetical protein